MRVQPFSYIEEVVAGGGGFPSLTGTVLDYWQSNLGLTGTTNVSSWVGQVNANDLQYVSSTGPAISGSNGGFNSVDTLTFNGVDTMLAKEFANVGGTNTGQIYISMYGAPHGDGAGWGAIFGFTGLASPYTFVENTMRAVSTTQIAHFRYPPGGQTESDSDTYGKGIYTLGIGSGTPGATFYNKGTTLNSVSPITYSSYLTARQGFAIGGYNAETGGALHGKVDIAGMVIWTNPTDYAADITAIESYFQGIYG
mgnify:CR=1 FL=1|tara:strand:- start:55 stop:813 length:759 start_codon:yes stop_codon:yes gene_type:complete